MKANLASFLVLAVLLLPFNASDAKGRKVYPPRLWGIAYGPFRDGQSPTGIYPSEADIQEDMKTLGPHTPRIRIYGVRKTLGLIPRLADRAGMMCYVGGHVGSDPVANSEEVERLIEVACSTRAAGIVVGNEVLYHGSLPLAQLIELIRSVKSHECVKRLGIPVGYADVYTTLLNYPGIDDLLALLDFLLVHIHPYHDGLPVEEAAEYVHRKWKLVKDQYENPYPDMDIIIGETGWPTAGETKGDAVPGERNQQYFLKSFVEIALRENIPLFFFEAFDEEWKGDESGVEAESHWGLWYADRTMKPRRFFSAPPPLVDILQTARCGAGPDRMDKIAGRVYGINPRELGSYRVVLYAGTNVWYVQPFANQPLTKIRRNLTWSNRTHLGDVYAALLVREGYDPLPVIPSLPETNGDVVAIVVKDCR
ncbi:glycosyl hydrolase family 17 protein [Thermoproteota archaeon]